MKNKFIFLIKIVKLQYNNSKIYNKSLIKISSDLTFLKLDFSVSTAGTSNTRLLASGSNLDKIFFLHHDRFFFV